MDQRGHLNRKLRFEADIIHRNRNFLREITLKILDEVGSVGQNMFEGNSEM